MFRRRPLTSTARALLGLTNLLLELLYPLLDALDPLVRRGLRRASRVPARSASRPMKQLLRSSTPHRGHHPLLFCLGGSLDSMRRAPRMPDGYPRDIPLLVIASRRARMRPVMQTAPRGLRRGTVSEGIRRWHA